MNDKEKLDYLMKKVAQLDKEMGVVRELFIDLGKVLQK